MIFPKYICNYSYFRYLKVIMKFSANHFKDIYKILDRFFKNFQIG